MRDIGEIRTEINAIDDELVKLFVRRLEIMVEVAACKRARNKPILDPKREQEILADVAAKVGPEYENGAQLLFQTLFYVCKARQREVLGSNLK